MKNSKERLDALRKKLRKRLKEERKLGISSKDFPSLTIAEVGELGLDTGTTVVVSFGKKRK